jgi:hypothetical protein
MGDIPYKADAFVKGLKRLRVCATRRRSISNANGFATLATVVAVASMAAACGTQHATAMRPVVSRSLGGTHLDYDKQAAQANLIASDFPQPPDWQEQAASPSTVTVAGNYSQCISFQGGDPLSGRLGAARSSVFAHADPQQGGYLQASSETSLYRDSTAAQQAFRFVNDDRAAGCIEAAMQKAAEPSVSLPQGVEPDIKVVKMGPPLMPASPVSAVAYQVTVNPPGTTPQASGVGLITFILNGKQTLELDTLGVLGDTFPQTTQVHLMCKLLSRANGGGTPDGCAASM